MHVLTVKYTEVQHRRFTVPLTVTWHAGRGRVAVLVWYDGRAEGCDAVPVQPDHERGNHHPQRPRLHAKGRRHGTGCHPRYLRLVIYIETFVPICHSFSFIQDITEHGRITSHNI